MALDAPGELELEQGHLHGPDRQAGLARELVDRDRRRPEQPGDDAAVAAGVGVLRLLARRGAVAVRFSLTPLAQLVDPALESFLLEKSEQLLASERRRETFTVFPPTDRRPTHTNPPGELLLRDVSQSAP